MEEKYNKVVNNEIKKIKNIINEKNKIIKELEEKLNKEKEIKKEIKNINTNTKINSKSYNKDNFNDDDNYNDNKEKEKENNFKNNFNTRKDFFNKNGFSNNNSNNKSNNNKSYSKENSNLNSMENSNSNTNSNPNSNNELNLYYQKQFIRDKQILLNENKSLFDKINELERIVKYQKDKEIKLMKVLFNLKKQGINIDEILQEEIKKDNNIKNNINNNNKLINEKNDQENKQNISIATSCVSFDSLISVPIYIDKPSNFIKPETIPLLNLKNINNKFNLEKASIKNTLNDLIQENVQQISSIYSY